MSYKPKSIDDKGLFKENIHAALYRSKDIKELLLNDINGKSSSQIQKEFKDHVKSHLFIDDTIQETDSFIFYDVILNRLEPHIKNCKVMMYAICHLSILDNYSKEGYHGNRADILCKMIENALINDDEVCNSFGIGRLSLDSIDIYNSTRFYGYIMTFNVPDFR